MTGSSFGKVFNITTFGESHGRAVGVVIQGCPPGLEIKEDIIQKALDARNSGRFWNTPRKETDRPLIMSGVFGGKTTGTPIMIMMENKDARPESYEGMRSVFRPGHGDFTYQAKYGVRDFRGGGRASARETAARVAAGAVAQTVLDRFNVSIESHTLAIGKMSWKSEDIFECPDSETVRKMEEEIRKASACGDSLGGVVGIRAVNVPAGIGEPVFDKLDADIAGAMMSIGAVKAVEIGAGIRASKMRGSENNDSILPGGFKTNNSGGILAGISNGDDITARVHVKPIPSISKPQKTIDENGKPVEISLEGRHDISAIPRINRVCEAMMAIVLTDHILRQRALNLKIGQK